MESRDGEGGEGLGMGFQGGLIDRPIAKTSAPSLLVRC